MTAEENNLEPAIVNLTWLGSCMVMVHYFVLMTYNIRLIAIREFGTVIHEFDPYFNYRATEVSVI
jgi:dolichyl-diphosphooligosaccharide--protein glycosyltransferase